MLNMDTTTEQDKDLLSQGAFGPPRDRQSGEPDAAGSTSYEGTVGVASASAPTDQAATAEQTNLLENALTPDVIQCEDTAVQVTGEKRKASTSPGSEIDDVAGGTTRRPNKARVIASTESPVAVCSSNNSPQEEDKVIYNISDSKSRSESDEEEVFIPDVRVTRSNKKRNVKKAADFSELKALRLEKSRKIDTAKDCDIKELVEEAAADNLNRSSSFREFIDSVVERLRKHSKSPVSRGSPLSRKSGSVYQDISEHSSDSFTASSCPSSNKKDKKKGNKKSAHDRPHKDYGQKSKRKIAIPITVTKEEAERELQYSRENWLDMDPAALGARCLDHLNEIENQRSRCSNISGRVAGRMKDSKRIAAEITKAMIERLTCAGDTFLLKNENCSERGA